MDKQLLTQIDEKIAACRAELARTTIELVNIKSVQEPPLPGAPFGAGPRRVLDTVLNMGANEGFYCEDYGVGVVSTALCEGQPDVGFWLHGDVVPEGDGWDYEPYNAVEYKGCIIGRGATDNKGQLAAVFHLLRIFKELNVPLKFNPAMYVGSNEETGMADLVGLPDNNDAKGFLNVCTPPRLSLVPDSGFPVGYGGKGGMTLYFKSRTPLVGWRLTAGLPEAPGRATATFESKALPCELPKCTVDGNTVTAETPPRHGAHPDPNGNMITNISAALLDAVELSDEEHRLLEFFKLASLDTNGKALGIATTCEDMSPLTVFAGRITCEDGYPCISLNIRYPIGITYETIVERVSAAADAYGFSLDKQVRGVSPYRLDPNSAMIKLLHEAAEEVTGEGKAPFTLGGGTYAHRLPNAYVYGTNGNLPPDDFKSGHGGAHGIDESVSLDRLQRAMRIFARALLKLNEIEW